MEKKVSETIWLALRYALLLAIVAFISSSSTISDFLVKITIYPVNFLLGFFHASFVYGSFLLFNSTLIEIIPACTALSAYILLLILNLTTPMNLWKRIGAVVFSFFVFLIINIIRIFALALLLESNFPYFDFIHKLFWYLLSIIIVMAVWFLEVYIFKIKSIPIYEDFKMLIKEFRNKTK